MSENPYQSSGVGEPKKRSIGLFVVLGSILAVLLVLFVAFGLMWSTTRVEQIKVIELNAAAEAAADHAAKASRDLAEDASPDLQNTDLSE